ncbi:hypothetical protein DID88_008908 [Monilinia fructigena]|uniref:LicD/FKTN/FKRP nucleotidyltransferase domain-containing protein n=1 Tax=Monilinia fructigena TaxID=38457 RepID=A0A395J988_9HELO|nr:hypothetical protein DID88_008908 [Monilinia fructigena]
MRAYSPTSNWDIENADKALSNLIQTYLATFSDIGVETWLMHGTLLGWWWNRKILPWDSDSDVQVSEDSMPLLSSFLLQHDSLSLQNSTYSGRTLTSSHCGTHSSRARQLKSHLRIRKSWRQSIMRKSLTLTDFEGHHFDDDKMEWIPVKQEIQKPMEPQKGSSTTTKKRSSTEGRGDQAGRRKKLQKRLKKKAKQKAAQEAQQNDTPPDEQKAADKRKKNEDKMKEEAEKVENSVSTFIIVQLSQGSIRPSNTCQQSIFQQLLH